jgi:hypothetical protein
VAVTTSKRRKGATVDRMARRVDKAAVTAGSPIAPDGREHDSGPAGRLRSRAARHASANGIAADVVCAKVPLPHLGEKVTMLQEKLSVVAVEKRRRDGLGSRTGSPIRATADVLRHALTDTQPRAVRSSINCGVTSESEFNRGGVQA